MKIKQKGVRWLWTGLLLMVCSFLLAGCGDDDTAVKITMPPQVASEDAGADTPTAVDVYWDATYSMAGYATLPEGNFYRTLPDELGDLGSSMGSVTFYRFGAEIKELPGREYRQFSNPGYYTEVITAFHNVIDKADASHLSIVVTDLFESGADWSNVTQKLKEKYFGQHLSVAIIGVKNPFKGDIFDVGIDAAKYAYDSGTAPERYRPFYLFIMGPDKKVTDFVSRFRERQQGVQNETQYLVFSEQLAAQLLDFSRLELSASQNIFRDDKLHVQDQRIREFGIDSSDDVTSLETTFPYQPALGAMPVDLSKLNVKAEVLTLEGDEWQPVEKRDSDLTAKIVPGEAENTYSVQVSFTPSKSLEDGKVNFVHVMAAPDAQSYRMPDWVTKWNMANADVNAAAFDGSKTINFLHIVESLKSSILAAAHPSLVNLDFVIDER